MKTRFRFEKLEVWQQARKINQMIYELTRRFPRAELYAMTSQIRRVSVSISSNIAEGSGRNSDKDFAHFLEQAYGSIMEVASICYLAFDLGYVTESGLNPLLDALENLVKQNAALNCPLAVTATKTPFPRAATPALD